MQRSARALLTLAVAAALAGGCGRSRDSSGLQLVATTTMLQAALADVGGHRVQVSVLMPPGSCPGHYDARPGDVRRIRGCSALFTHGYERFVPSLVGAAGTPAPRVLRVAVGGNWLIPAVYSAACEKVSEMLSQLDPAHRSEYQARLAAARSRAARLDAELRRKATAALPRPVPAISSDQQAPFLKWIGFEVVGTYGRAEEFTPKQLHSLAKVARSKGVRVVVDNLQSGPNAGRQLAQEVGASHVTLSSFPGGFPGTDSWEKCVSRNVDLVLAAATTGAKGKG